MNSTLESLIGTRASSNGGKGTQAARPRRLRTLPGVRAMVRETTLCQDLIYPLFAVHGQGVRNPVTSMPGVFQLSVKNLAAEADAAAALGVPAVLLFGIPAAKDPQGSESHARDGIIPQAIAAIKDRHPDLIVITDVCMCEYTNHGHCGILNTGSPRPVPSLPEGYLLNAETLDALQRIALSHAEAGADIVAPSGMIDGMMAAIRGALDVQEGADFLMVKPALPYLDVIRLLRDSFPRIPLSPTT